MLALALTTSGCLPFASRAPKPPPSPHDLACIQHSSIDTWEHRLRGERYVGVTLAEHRTRVYLPRVRRRFRKAGLPQSLALLPLVESDFQRTAVGHANERGLWQLRRATARRFGLVVRARHDERLHPYRATRAAARYLRYLHQRYRDWPLAIAAYNAGEHRVDDALQRHPHATFWELAAAGELAHTTRDFVPRFLAVVRIVDGTSVCHTAPRPSQMAATG